VAVPALGGEGVDPRRFRNASNITIADRELFVADEGNRRIQVFSLDTLRLQHVWPLGDVVDRSDSSAGTKARVDVASHGRTTYILDGPNSRVLKHTAGRDQPSTLIRVARGSRQWVRIALDRLGRIYLFDAARSALDIYDRGGRWLQKATDAGEVRDRFARPAITVVVNQRGPVRTEYFRLPASLAATAGEELLFDRRGRRVRIAKSDVVEPKVYVERGTWISRAIDSGIHACQWHRLDVEIPQLPPGTQVVISTFTSDLATGHPHETSPLWQPCLNECGRTQPEAERAEQRRTIDDALVQSREGQYLWVLARLESDGFDTPLVASIDARFPRDSYLRYLPAIYSADDESRWFLERFLSIFQTEWDGIERCVREVSRYFDVDATPATGGWLETLARWMSVQLEQTWTPEQKRNLLRVSKRLLGRRGTPGGLRDFLQAYLQNMTGISPDRQGRWPILAEGFRERHRLMVGSARDGVLGAGTTLWSDSVVGRPQLDVFAQEGSMRLVSTGDPARDLFHQYSHRFTVAVPAAWVQTEDDERMFRRAIEAEKPAHTSYELNLVAARFRVGIQSTVGIDTIVGGQPCARVGGICTTAAPGQPPRNRLGYDTVLGGDPAGTRPVQIPASRIGVDTILN